MKGRLILIGLLCWPAAALLHFANDHGKAEKQREPIYQFEVLDRGVVYVVDYGLTLEDCQERWRRQRGGYCRRVV